MALISKKELKENFLLENQYGLKGSCDPPWPSNTILLYNLSTYDCPNSAVQNKLQTEGACKAKEGQIWERFDNKPGSENSATETDPLHAELKLMKKVMTDLNKMDPKPRKIKLSIIISYSPCTDCANALIDFKHYVENGMDILCSIIIKFSSFYKCYETDKSCNNLPGLCKLLKNSVALETFNGVGDWNWFLSYVLHMFDAIEMLIGLSNERIEREAVDDEILHTIKFHMDTDGRPDYVPLAIGNSATYKDAHVAAVNEKEKHGIAGSVKEAASRLKKLDVDIVAKGTGEQNTDARGDLQATRNGNAQSKVQSKHRVPGASGSQLSSGKGNTSSRGSVRSRSRVNAQEQRHKRQHSCEEDPYGYDRRHCSREIDGDQHYGNSSTSKDAHAAAVNEKGKQGKNGSVKETASRQKKLDDDVLAKGNSANYIDAHAAAVNEKGKRGIDGSVKETGSRLKKLDVDVATKSNSATYKDTHAAAVNEKGKQGIGGSVKGAASRLKKLDVDVPAKETGVQSAVVCGDRIRNPSLLASTDRLDSSSGNLQATRNGNAQSKVQSKKRVPEAIGNKKSTGKGNTSAQGSVRRRRRGNTRGQRPKRQYSCGEDAYGYDRRYNSKEIDGDHHCGIGVQSADACGDRIGIPSLFASTDRLDSSSGNLQATRKQRVREASGNQQSSGKGNTSFRGSFRSRSRGNAQGQGLKRQHSFEEDDYGYDRRHCPREIDGDLYYEYHDWYRQYKQPYSGGNIHLYGWPGYLRW